MAQRRGKLIVIAGIDGSGKATQAHLLAERLRAAGKAAEIVDFPRYGKGFFAEMVAAYLRGEFGPADRVDAKLASLMYAGDRWQAKPEIERLLDAGTTVICNRYVCSNKAHQGGKIADPAARRAFFTWEDELEFGVLGLPRPDLTVLLHVPPEVGQGMVDKKEDRAYLKGKKRDVHEESRDHLRRAGDTYLELCELEPRWQRVDCVKEGRLLPREEIAGMVWDCVKKLL